MDKEENVDDNDGGNAKPSQKHTEGSLRKRTGRKQRRGGRQEEEERIQKNGGRNTVLFPSNNPEMSHREWAARSPGKY